MNSTAAQSIRVNESDVGERLDDFDENGVRMYLVQNVDQTVRRALELEPGTSTSGEGNQGLVKTTMQALHSREQDIDLRSRIVILPKTKERRSPRVTFHALQEWEGYVTEISDMEFNARLTDLTSRAKYASEEASIPRDEISDDDADKMQVGSIFRWVIGYERKGRAKKRVSQIVFRDLPMITKSDMRDGKQWANKIAAAFEQ